MITLRLIINNFRYIYSNHQEARCAEIINLDQAKQSKQHTEVTSSHFKITMSFEPLFSSQVQRIVNQFYYGNGKSKVSISNRNYNGQ